MKYTVLDLTQNILSSMDSSEVNSISDTTESRQVAEIIRTCYYNIISRANLPEHQQLVELTASGDTDLPVVMYRPDNVLRIDWIKYFDAGDTDLNNYEYVTLLPLQQYLDLTQNADPTEDTTGTLTINGQTFYYRNDGQPSRCTILSNSTVLFDSFDNTVDATLQTSKTLCFGQIIPTFDIVDSFIPDLDDQQFPLLLNEAKSTAFLELKQISNDSAIRESKRQWNSLQRSKEFVLSSAFDNLPNFGRK